MPGRPIGSVRPRAAVPLPLDPQQQQNFRGFLLAWYGVHARDLPWRTHPDPYRTWVSEIMLQQTRVGAVLDHYRAFLARFPTLLSLALSPEEDVLAAWSGLGYYRRARMLHKAAQFVAKEHDGTLPRTAQALRQLPGIGIYTGAAIASIAFNEPIAVVDGNVERVLLRIAGMPEKANKQTEDFLTQFSQALLDTARPGDYNQAIMELGATVCLPRNPRCLQCPVLDLCRTRGEHVTVDRAPMRSERVRYALTTRKSAGGEGVEVLLHRRPHDASLMPMMLELPQIETPMETQIETEADAGSEAPFAEQPLLRLRHAIVGTNYYVEVVALDRKRSVQARLQGEGKLQWVAAAQLARQPLTGLARKVLQRTGMMAADLGADDLLDGLNGHAADNAPAGDPQVPLLIGRHNRAQDGAATAVDPDEV